MAYTATANAKTCTFEHDKCRGTPEFPKAGQNLAWASGTGDDGAGENWIPSMIDGWWNEYELTSPDYVASLPDG